MLFGTFDIDFFCELDVLAFGCFCFAVRFRSTLWLQTQKRSECSTGVRARCFGDDFGRAAGDDLSATGAALGSDVDDPVRRFDYVQVVFDNEHGVSDFDEVVQHFQQQLNVRKVQTRRGLVEQIERAARTLLHQLAREFDALGFAAGKCWRRLADLQIVEANVVQRL